jgi:ubiquinone/menaquinone biosynthesis C-methylase UbiE
MNSPMSQTNEHRVTVAFDGQSAYFDELYGSDVIIQYKRDRVREHLLLHLKPESNILELNAGTGEDAVFLARRGHQVHATDISEGMQKKLAEKIAYFGLSGSVTHELCSFTALQTLQRKGPYDCIFSNFAGLNCTNRLDQVLADFDGLLKPGGMVVLVVLPAFCLWETLLVFKGKIRTATRRFFSSKGRKAKIDGFSFRCWYYSPHVIKHFMKEKYSMLGLEGLCTIVPPSYLSGFPKNHPKIYAILCRMENSVKNKWPWRSVGDYYICSFKKK